MSIEPFNRLVKLATRAFYDDITTKGDNQPKTGRSDNRGIVVVMLDALTRVTKRPSLRIIHNDALINSSFKRSSNSPSISILQTFHIESPKPEREREEIYVVRYRLHRMKKKLKDELEDKDTSGVYMLHLWEKIQCFRCTATDIYGR
uniref:Uncharacterized protein n=1 Tax=Vitis vinifera TaxID=29760 RepID=F6HF07_VITVI